MPSELDMGRSGPTPRVDRRFDAFLQAPIDEDRKDRLFSVLSALARLDLDPWHEAAALASQSRKAAVARLAALVASLPDAASVPRDPASVASRLVALLPRSSSVPVPTFGSLDGVPAKGRSLAKPALILAVVVLAAWAISGWPVELQLPWSSSSDSNQESPLGSER